MDLSRYPLTVPGKRGLLMRPLSFRPDPPPISGESLLGLMARAVERNRVSALVRLLRLADVDGGTAMRSSSLTTAEATRLAFVMKVGAAEVLGRLHRDPDLQGPRGEWIDFFGVTVRARYRETSRRRVSPRALRLSPHHRAIHDLRPFSFCPETMETLIDACPVCRRPLGWSITRGIQFCEGCLDGDDEPTVDLRDHPQPLVGVSDDAALRLVTDLVDPDPDTRAKAVANVDPLLRGSGPGELFELAIVLARASSTDPGADAPRIRALRKREDYGYLTPELLSVMGRTLIDWQRGIGALCDRARLSAGLRRGVLGTFKEIGHLNNVPNKNRVSPALAEAFRRAVDADMRRTAFSNVVLRQRGTRHRSDLLDTEEAATVLGVKHALLPRLAAAGAVTAMRGPGAKKSLMLYRRDEIEAVAAVKRDMTEATKAARAVGLPVEAMEALADAGLIARAEGPALLLGSYAAYYRQGSIDTLVRDVFDRVRRLPRSSSLVRMAAAMNRMPPGSKPWLDIVLALASGELPAFADERTRLVSGLFVDEAALAAVALRGGKALPVEDDDVTLSYREVAPLIGMPAPNVTWLVAAGLLGSGASGDRRITRRDVKAFNEGYASTAEVARSLGVPARSVKPMLALRGIEPAAALHNGNRYVWHRAEVIGP